MDGVLGIVENRSVLREQDRVDGGGGCYPDFGGTGSEGEAHQKQKQQRRDSRQTQQRAAVAGVFGHHLESFFG